MKKTHGFNAYKLSTYIVVSIFSLISFLWFLIFNRYHIIGFQEETQLFRTDAIYLESYLARPGGVIDYISAFFMQFYYYQWLGALIITISLSLIFILCIRICNTNKNTIERFIFFLFVIPTLLLVVSSDMSFHLTYILSICFTLACVALYLNITEGKKRYTAGILLYLIVYFITGGNALLYALLIIVNELFSKRRSFLYIVVQIAISLIVPYIAYLFVYIAPINSTYFAFTPFALSYTHKVYFIVWLSIPIIYIIAEYINSKNWLAKTKPIKVIIPTYIVISLMLFYGIKVAYEPDMECIAKIGYEAEKGNWKNILEIRAEHPNLQKGQNLATFYTNIALSELGLLSSQMFHFEQTGKEGLFLDWNPIHFSPWYTGEQYYRLGIIQAAEHCAYEDMLANKREYGSRALKRLVNTTMLRRDSNGFDKYLNLFEGSLVYKDWAKQQRERYQIAKIDSTYEIHGMPKPEEVCDLMLHYDSPDLDLDILLKGNPHNKKLFENLMAYLLLKKDLNTMIACMDKYYTGMGYDKIPRHYEEAILIAKYVTNGLESTLAKFHVSKETQIEFMEFTKAASSATHKAAKDLLRKLYGHTYWYYAMINI